MMKYLWLNLVFLFLISCNIDESAEEDQDAGTQELDSTVCVQLNHRSNVEMLELFFYSDGAVRGEGASNTGKLGKNYAVQVIGTQEGEDELQLKVSYYEKDNPSAVRSSEETWKKEGRKWITKNRSGATAATAYWRVRCPGDTTVLEGLYDVVFGFNEGYAVVERNKKFGLINEQEELVIPLKYANLSDVVEGTLTYQNEQAQQYGLMHADGTEITGANYSHLLPQNEGLIAYYDDDMRAWGFMDSSLAVVIKPRFSQINTYVDDYTELPFNEGLANVAVAGRWGYINHQGEKVLPLEYAYAAPFKDGKARVSKDGKWMYINKKGDCVEGCE